VGPSAIRAVAKGSPKTKGTASYTNRASGDTTSPGEHRNPGQVESFDGHEPTVVVPADVLVENVA
jgi:hypothetical protein